MEVVSMCKELRMRRFRLPHFALSLSTTAVLPGAPPKCFIRNRNQKTPRLAMPPRRRYLPDNSYEDWSLSELIIPER